MDKEAQTDLQINELIRKRWSPRAFSEKNVDQEKLERIFEAARWSASCFNEQPWRFIVGVKGQDEKYRKLFDTLAEGNQVWCKSVPVLLIIAGKKTFSINGKPNQWYSYDCGQAAAYISMQAMTEGLYVHQMAGFNAAKVRTAFSLSDDLNPVTAMAIGYIGDPETLPDNLKKTELSKRERRPYKDMFI